LTVAARRVWSLEKSAVVSDHGALPVYAAVGSAVCTAGTATANSCRWRPRTPKLPA